MIKAGACPSALVLDVLNRYQVQPQSVLSAVIQTFFAKPATSKRLSVIAAATIRVAAAAKVQGITSSRRSGIPESRYHNGYMAFYETKPLERLS
jgi:hypothetical protein